jgi:uncharacterized repeat protein (TIGR01451 family)
MNMKCRLKQLMCLPMVLAFILPGLAQTVRAVNLVQEFYLPMPEQQIYTANGALVSGTGSTIASTFSVVVTGTGTVIYYDQWEDGYEPDLGNPTQPTTQIWGDGNDAHGIPPGFAHNPLGLPAGTVITLTNNVTLPRNPSTILWDARDRLAASKALVITRAAWPIPTGPVFAGAAGVLSTMDYGTNYISPVGQDLANNLFKYVGMFIMAAQNNTAVTIDPNGTGVGTTNIVLNQGESYLINGGIKKGGRVSASKPIQADLLIGHVGASFASDWFTLYPVSAWDNTYYTPVSSAASGSQPAYVYLYNPGTNAITINYNTRAGNGSFAIPGTNGVYQFQMPIGSGASFVSAGGQKFFPLCTVAANNSSDTAYNWGFTLVPKAALTTEAAVGWGPGSADGTVNGSPVWVTTLGGTTVYVDYKGDHAGPLTDPNGNKYDTNFTVVNLQALKIYDPSKNQTGMRVYTVDGTLLTAAWGEDADKASPGNPYIDAGTTVLPFPVPTLQKSALVVTDTPPAGLSVGDTIQYTVRIDNKGLLPLGNTVVIDAPSTNLTYITNSSTWNGSAIPDSASGTSFPLDAPGFTIPLILSQGSSTFTYLYTVNASGVISNSVNIGGTPISSTATISPPLTNAASVSLNFTDTNGVPLAAYAAGANVFVNMTNAVGNTSAGSAQTIFVTVTDTNTGDAETIALIETGVNTGIFRNPGGLPTSLTSGLVNQDGILNVVAGDTLSVSYTDPVYGDSASSTALIQIPARTKQLYLSVNGSTNGVQALNRIDPVAYGHSPTRTSIDIGSVGGTTTASSIGIDGSFATNGTATTFAFNYTTGAGSNRLMLVSVGVQNTTGSAPTVNTVTYSGLTLNLVGSASKTGSNPKYGLSLYSLTNPPAGTAAVSVDWGGGDSCIVGVNTFTNVDQTTPLTSTNTAAPGTAITVNSATNQLVFGAVYNNGTISLAAGQNAVVRWTNNYAGSFYAMGNTVSGSNAPTTAISWTASAYAVGVSINPSTTFVAGGGGGPATNVASFVQTPAFAQPFTLPSGGSVTITNFITLTNGSLSASPAITATLRANGTNFLTLTSPAYTAASNMLVWSGVVSSNVTIPAGAAITYTISNGVAGTAFHVNYDSATAPSKISLPAATVIAVNTFGIYDAPYPGGSIVTTPVAGSTLYVRANVGDPFGAYDITGLGLAFTAPDTNNNFSVTLNDTNAVASDTSSKTYEYVWNTGPATGNYNIAATATEGTEGVTAVASAGISTIFLDLGTPSTTTFTGGNNGTPTNAYLAGSSVCVRVSDLNRNTNATTSENIIVTVSSSSGDSEILTLIETGTNSGVFSSCINTSTNLAGAPNDGTLFAPVGSVLTASYTDPTDASDSTSDTATIQPVPGVPGIVINKTILSPAGGQVGVGQPVTYNLQVVNVGSTTLPSLKITDTFSSSKLSYASASVTPDTIAAGTLTWNNLGAFTPGQSTNITVTFTTLATGTATNSATANGSTATNSSSVTLAVNAAAVNVVKVLLSPTNQPVSIQSNVVFRITVQNVGNTAINYLPMEDAFSGAYYQYVSATIPPNGSGAGSLIWTNLAFPVALATNAILTNDITMKVVGQGSPANNVATVDFATDVFGNPVPATSGSVGVTTSAAGISGHVYNDINQSGVFTNGDTGLANVTLQLYTDPNGDGNPADGTLVQVTTTDGGGYYELLNLTMGRYVVVETDLPGYSSSVPADNRLPLNLTNLVTVTNNYFFDYIPAPSVYSTFSGRVYDDVNGYGTNTSQAGLNNFTIDLVQDVNSNSVADLGEPVAGTTVTDTNGNYSLSGITPGHYVLRESVPFGYYATGDSQPPNNAQIAFVTTNGIVSTNNSFFARQSPVAVADTNATVYFTPVTIYPLTNDISPNGDALTISNITTTGGLLTFSPGGTNLTFTPTNSGTIVITYSINDTHGGMSTNTISLGVSPAPLTVTGGNVSRLYGQANPVLGGTITGLLNGDNVTATYATGATASSPAGNYPIIPTLVDPDGRLVNYSVTTNNGTLTVNQVVLGITANNTNRFYNAANPVFTYTPNGFVNGDTISVLSGAPSLTTVAVSNSPVGSYMIVATNGTLSATNYVFSFTNGLLTVNMAAPVVTWPTPTNIIYGTPLGGSQNNATSSVPGTAVYNPTNGTVLSAGTNTLTVVFTSTDTNYSATNLSVALVVTPAPLSVTASNVSRLYGQLNPVFGGTITGIQNSDNITATYATSATTNSPVGGYPIVPTLVDPNGRLVNYAIATNNGTLTINPVLLGITANNTNRLYNTANPTFTYTATGFVNGDTASVLSGNPSLTTIALTNSPVGVYPIVATNGTLSATNYVFSFTNGTLTVIGGSYAITWANPASIVYGTLLGTNQNNATSSVPGTAVYNPTNGTVLPAGTNTLAVVFTPTDTNYALTNLSVTLVVTPAPLTITASSTNKVYNTTLTLGAMAFTSSGLMNSETIGGVTLGSAGTVAGAPVGVYPITAGNATGGTFNPANYSITYSNGVLTVLTAAYTATWPVPTNIVYGTALGTNQNAATATIPGSFVYNPTNGTILPVGTNLLSVAFTPADTNYASTNLSVNLVVTPAPLTVTANDQTKLYGQTLALGAGETAFTTSALVNGDSVASVTLASAGAAGVAGTGSYPIVPSAAVGIGLTNYSIAYSNGTLTVALTAPLLTWPTPTNIVYGTPLGGSQNNATSSVPGTAVYNPTNGTVLSVGTNTLTVVYTPTDTNYAATNLSVLLVVTPAPLSVTASNASRLYGQLNPVFGGTISGIQNSDNLTATYTTSAVTNSPAGGYPIIPTLVDPNSRLGNYVVTTNNGTLTVSKAVLAITANNTNRLYGATNPVFTYTAVGFVNGDTASVVSGAPSLTTPAVTNSPVGSYPIVTTNGTLNATNYVFNFTNGVLTVGQGAYTTTWTNPASIVYGTLLGGSQNNATSSVPGTAVYNPTNGTVLSVGTNTLTVVYTPTDTNYAATNLSVLLIVTPAPLSVTASNVSRQFGQTNPVLGGTIIGIQNGDNITATYTTSAVTNSPAGGYPIIPTLVDPNSRLVNYSVTTNNGTLTVTNVTLATADIAVLKTGPANGGAGSNLTYTITVTNIGPSTATNVIVQDLLPAGFTFVSAVPATATVVSNVVTWPGFNLANHARSNFTVTAISAEGGSFTNIASGSATGTSDPNPTNNDGTLTNSQSRTVVTPRADVAIFKTGSTNVAAGGTVTYTITATNFGPSTATNVVVKDNLPGNVTFQSASGGYSLSNSVITWSSLNLSNGEAVSYTVMVTAPASGSFTNIASSTSGTTDPNPTNNNGAAAASKVRTTISPVADLIVLLTGPINVSVGDSFTYTITLTNGGPSAATAIVLKDILPASLTFLAASGGGASSNNIITWPTLGSLAYGGKTNFTITVSAPGIGQFTNFAFATAGTFDPNPTNNNGSASVSQVQTIVASAQFNLLAGPAVLNPQTGLYEESVIVTNIGATTVAGVRLYVGGLRTGVTLYNATGTTNSTPYVQYNSPVNPGNTVTFHLEFYDPSRLAFTHTLTAVAILPPNTSVTGTNGVAITKSFLDTRLEGDTRFVIEFATTPGKTYTIIYSDDLVNWKVATPSVTANANVTQWYDDGPPKTDSKPASVSSRYYRVIAN